MSSCRQDLPAKVFCSAKNLGGLTELGNYTIASLFISQFLSDKSFNTPVFILGAVGGLLLHLTGLLVSR